MFNYPTNVSRPYMPNPEQIFTNLASQLEAVGITVTPTGNEWNPAYLDRIQGGADHGIHLLGWTGDYNDTDNFVGVFFGQATQRVGLRQPGAVRRADRGPRHSRLEEQTTLYKAINEMIAEFIPAIPLAHPAPSLAFDARVTSYPASPVNDEVFNQIELSE